MKKLFSKPWITISIILAGTLFFIFQLTRIQIDNNNYRFIPEKNESRVITEYIDEEFGSAITVLIGLEQKFDTVFTKDFLQSLNNFDKELNQLEMVDAVVSLVSTDFISGEDGAIIVEPLTPEYFEGSDEEIIAVKKRIASWDMYDKMLVSDDFSATQVVVAIDVPNEEAGSPEVLKTFKQIRKLANNNFDSKKTNVYVTGIPVFSATINEAVINDLIFLVPLVVLVVVITLFFAFRRFFAILIPITTVIISAIWAIGAMPLFGIKMSILTTVLPVILVAVGSAYGIHVVSHYLDLRNKAEKTARKKLKTSDTINENKSLLTKEEHTELVYDLIRRVGKPVFLAALTTFAGFVAFCFTSVIPIREFGFFASFGVIIAVAVSLSFIPSLFIVRGPTPIKKRKFTNGNSDNNEESDPLSEAVTSSFLGLIKGKRKILIFSALIAIASAALIPQIIVDNVLVEYFRDDTDMALSDTFVRNYFGGSKIVSLMIQGKPVKEGETPNKVLTPDVLKAMDNLAYYLETIPEVGKVTSFTHLLKRINQVYNEDEDASGIKPLNASYSSGNDSFGFDDSSSFGFGFADDSNDFGFDGTSANDNFGFSAADDFNFGFEELDYEPGNDLIVSDYKKESKSSPISIKNPEDLIKYYDDARLLTDKKNISQVELVENLKKLVNYEGVSYYEIPFDPERYGQANYEGLEQVISNYMMLLSGDIGAFANDPLEPTALKMNIQLRTTGQIDTDRAISAMNDYIDANFPNTVETKVGGFALVEGALNKLVVQSQLVSVITSLLMVFLIIAFSYKSALVGLIGIIPLAIAILVDFGIMAIMNIKLNIGTALVASVAVGIGVDYAIHFIEAYFREKQLYEKDVKTKGGSGLKNYLQRAFETSGKPILINAMSVGLGFGVLAFSKFTILAQFGLLIAFTMLSSSLAALLVLPVLLDWVMPRVKK